MARSVFVFVVFYLSLIVPVSWAGGGLRVFYTYEKDVLGGILQDFGAVAGEAVEAEFRAQHDIKQQLLSIENPAEYPDAIIIPSDHIGIHSYVKYSLIDPRLFNVKLNARVLASGTSDGGLYGIPLIQGNHLMLFYNKRLVSAPALDWKSLLAQKTELDAKGIDTIAWNYNEPYYFLPFLGAFGGWPLAQGKVELNTPAMAGALDFYNQLKEVRKAGCDSACARLLFKDNKLAYMISGVWDGVSFHQALGNDLGLTAIPMAGDKKMVPPFSTHLIAFPNNSLDSDRRNKLIQLVNYLQSPDVQRRLWDQAGAIPVEPAAFEYAQKNAKSYLQQALVLMADTKAVPSDESMSLIWDALGKGMTLRREGSVDGATAANYMQRMAERHIRHVKR